MYKFLILLAGLFVFGNVNGQMVEVQADYNGVGDCVFSAHNNSKTPIFLNIDFGDLENTTFTEVLPYIKLLEPGFNSLFTLERDLDSDVPRFNYEIKSFRSNPMADINLDFPYLIPFAPNSKVKVFDVPDIQGFWGRDELKSWSATGFLCKPGEKVYASRQGTIVEIVGNRDGDAQNWYHTWNNSITILQPDGTLICYKNVVDKSKKLKLNQKIYAGQILGEVASNSDKIVLMIFHSSLNSKDLLFIIPSFFINEGEIDFVNSSTEYLVKHPNNIRAMEMTKKEQKKILGKKR